MNWFVENIGTIVVALVLADVPRVLIPKNVTCKLKNQKKIRNNLLPCKRTNLFTLPAKGGAIIVPPFAL